MVTANQETVPGTWRKQFRLTSMRLEYDDRGYEQQFLSEETGQALCRYLKEVPNVIRLALGPKDRFSIDNMFGGDLNKAHSLHNWIVKTVQFERPFVTWSLSRSQIERIERELMRAAPAGKEILHGVKADRILRGMTKAGSPLNPDVTVPYISVGGDAFGEMGFIVGYSDISKTVAFVQSKEESSFKKFGGILSRRIGIVTTLDYLVKIEPLREPLPPSPRVAGIRGIRSTP
jgi:hypothetical protein